MLSYPRGRLGVLVVVCSSLSCAIWLVGCSRNDEHVDSNQEATSHQASVQSIESLLVSADTQIVESRHGKVLSSDRRQQLAELIKTSTVTPGGIRFPEPDGDIPPPPIPPPALLLYVVDGKASPTHVKSEDAFVVFEVYIDHGASFAQAYHPGKSGAFLFESDGWRTFLTTIAND